MEGLCLGDRLLDYIVLLEVVNAKGKKTTANMNGNRYERMMKRHCKTCKKRMLPRLGKTLISMVKVFAKFLRQPGSSRAEEAAGFKTLTQHSKCSPDMSAVENYIDLLQDRLLLTAPVEIESRAAFIKRVRRTLSWMNQNARQHTRGLCRNQKKRAAE